MKSLILLTIAVLIYSNIAHSQCANGNISSIVPQPTQVIVASSTCSTLVVKWQGAANQTYCVSATYFNTVANKRDTVYGINTKCDGTQNCTDTIPVIVGTKVTWSVQAISNGSMSYPVVSVLEYPIRACSGGGSTFCVKVFLQGAYDAATKKMNNTLNALGILQAQAVNQPYNIPGFNYAGEEKVGAGFFASHPEIVDWMLLELRDANAPATVIASRAAFVRQDGILVDTNGTRTNIFFPGIAAGSYYLSVRHRNHLGVRSAFPIDFTCGLKCYDFTTAASKSLKKETYTSSVQMGTVWVMRGGNANLNNNTKYNGPANDQNQILNIKLGGSLSTVLNNVYAPEDVNMNGNIKWNGPGNDQNFLLNIALSGLLSFVLNEQL